MLCLSNEILTEYEEIFTEFWGPTVAQNLLGVLVTSENISFNSIYYNFRLVDGDPDDNKFAETYLSATADYLVSNDVKVYNLKEIDFPPINTLTLQEFSAFIRKRNF